MRNSLPTLAAAVLVLGLAFWLYDDSASVVQAADEEVQGTSLATRMGELQRFSQKLVLAMRAGNAEATEFYAHEVGEASELIQAEFETYDGHAVRSLMATMLDPAIARIARSATEQAEPDELIGALIQGCNSCHIATEHGFIRIVERPDNPYLQEF